MGVSGPAGSSWRSWAPWWFLSSESGKEYDVVTVVDVALYFMWALILLLGTSAYANIRRGKRNANKVAWKWSFIKSTFWTTVFVILVYVARVAVRLPEDMKATTMLVECRESTKGGKITDTFRDCTTGQGGFCTKEEPCTPCDTFVKPFEFDGIVYEGYCEQCSDSYVGYCNFQGGDKGPYCREFDGTVAPCQRCCLPAWGGADTRKALAANGCDLVFNSSSFGWNPAEYEPCKGSSVLTRFGCCPPSPQNSTATDGTGATDDSDACAHSGPNGGGWEFCFSSGRATMDAPAPSGCPLYSNGRLETTYCTIPARK